MSKKIPIESARSHRFAGPCGDSALDISRCQVNALLSWIGVRRDRVLHVAAPNLDETRCGQRFNWSGGAGGAPDGLASAGLGIVGFFLAGGTIGIVPAAGATG